jgi:hypothetical protein
MMSTKSKIVLLLLVASGFAAGFTYAAGGLGTYVPPHFLGVGTGPLTPAGLAAQVEASCAAIQETTSGQRTASATQSLRGSSEEASQ